MIKPLFTNRCRMTLLILFAAFLFCIPGKTRAQTTLTTGDIAFTGYHSLTGNAAGADTISFVLLVPISSGTRINFTDRGYSTDGTWQAFGSSEGSVSWVTSTAIASGTEIIIAGSNVYTYNASTGVRSANGSMSTIDGTAAYPLALAGTGDQVIAYQSPGGAASGPQTVGNTFIAGIHYGYCNGNTSATSWDDLDGAGPGACTAGPNSSALPPGLTDGTSAIYIPTLPSNTIVGCAKFNCTGTPALNAAGVRTAVYNISNWTRSATSIPMASNCLFISSGPTITGHPANRTVCVNASTTFTVTATNPGTYQWQEDNGGGFVDITPGAPFSGVNTATLTINPIGAGRNGYRYRCRVTNGTSVNSNPATLTVDVVAGTSAVSSVSCNGGSNGAASVTVTSGILPIASYSWSPSGGTSASASGLAANTYTCTITDNIGCTGTVQAIITEPAQPVSATITTVNNVSCPGGTNGNMTVTPSGGTPGYTYLWNTTGTTASIFGLTAGTYTVTVRDSKNCPTTASATVTAPPAFVTSGSTTPVSCNGGGNGTATVTVSSGGQPPYTYQWSPSAGSQSTATATGLTAGSYSVTVRDNNLCPTVVSGVTVSQPTDFTVGTSQTNVSCNGGNNGTATVSVSGATAPYTYSWSPSGGTNAMATGLAMGTYTVTITDNNTCQTTRTFNITQPAAALGGTISKTDVSCNGGGNGTATVNVNGGTTPYSYSWSPSGGTNATAIGLGMGTYTVTVTDFNGCQITRTTTVNQPAAALGGIITKTDVSCNGGGNGTATVNVNGGTTPYSYSWSPSGGTNATAIGLGMGTYTVTVTDFNGCQITRTTTVNQPAAALGGTISKTDVSCNGGGNGTATVNVNGGTTPYSYSWSPSGGTNATATGLGMGTYTVTVTDFNGCQITRTTTVNQPAAALGGIITKTDVSCNGGGNGTATVNVNGGTTPYSYSWSPSGGTNAMATGLGMGTYTVTVTDFNGCQITRTTTVNQPATALSGNTVVADVACFGNSTGAIDLTAAGGTLPYTYDWGGGITTEDRTGLVAGSYSVTITDGNGCTGSASATVNQPAAAVSGTTVVTNVACFGGSTGAINLTPTGGVFPYTYNWVGGVTTEDRVLLSVGSYSVTITDANGCTSTVSATVTQPAAALSGSTMVTNVSCFSGSNGAIDLTPAGGTLPYTYDWGSGITTEDRTGLGMGSYSVTIMDANGCMATVSATVTEPTEIAGLTLASSMNVSCNGGSNGAASVTPATGGTGTITYDWTPGTPIGDGTTSITGLSAGTYTVTATDANGCTRSLPVTITQPTALAGLVFSSSTNVSCNGGANGAASVTPATGGTGTITYDWTPGTPTGDGTTSITGLSAGTYTVTATDANGCTRSLPVTITQPSALAGLVFSSSTNVSCNGGANGAASVTPATGGTGTITYDWTPGTPIGDGTTSITGLSAGTYTVTATDANGCTRSLPVTITQPTALAGLVFSSSTNVSCNGGANGSVSVTPATGGTGTITYDWTPGTPTGDGTTSITGLSAGTYTVTATDANGCTRSLPVTITQPSALAGLVFSSSTNVSCNGGANGAASVTPATGGTGTITYDWTPGTPTGDGTTSITGLSAGTYTVTATDANGCTRSLPVTITQPTALAGLVFSSSTNVSCNGGANGSVSVTPATGGTGTITYDWTPGTPTGDGTTSITGLSAGTYTVTATDANGCTRSLPVTITQPTALAGLVFSSSTNVSCNGGSNGSASVTPATGGTGTITYDWTPGTPTGDGTTFITGLSAGTYTVTATDANGCTRSLPVTITQPTALAGLTLSSSSNVSCNGGSNGSASVTPATGGTGTITYDWTPGTPTGDGTTSITGLSAGTYTITATDANGCTKTLPVTITEPTALSEISLVSSSSVSCNGGANGSASVTPVTGGTGTITYDWTPGTPTGDGTTSVSGLSVGTYTVTATDANGCSESLSVTITEPSALVVTPSQTNLACNGVPTGTAAVTVTGGTGTYTYTWSPSGGTAATASNLLAGTYAVTIKDANLCETTQSFTITEPVLAVSSITATACNSYTLNGTTYNTSGTYTQVLTNAGGCDSTITLNLTVNYASAFTFAATACDSYTLNGTTYTTSGTYVQTLPNASGCDSTLTLNLTVNYSSASSMSATACDSYTLNGTTYTTSGIYTQVRPNAVGCDSTITLDLTINYSTSYTLTATGCDSYTLNGQTYTESGTYTQVLTNQVGCDWNFTLVLTINHSTATSLTQVACGSYTLNGQTYTASGTYTQTFTNSVDCDSIVTLNLTIKQPTGSSLTETACGSYTLNSQTYNTSGTYTQTFVNSVGCDSIVTLHLTIKTVNVDVETNGFVIASEANNATYQWLDCSNFTPISGATSQSYVVTANGDYAVVVTQNGCTDTSACVPVYGVSITENDIKNIDVTVYPNPTLDYVYIQTDGVIKSIDVMDISGKKYQPHFSVGKLDLTTIPSGIYLVRVTLNSGQQALTRVIKM